MTTKYTTGRDNNVMIIQIDDSSMRQQRVLFTITANSDNLTRRQEIKLAQEHQNPHYFL